jgi:hypothetical protein
MTTYAEIAHESFGARRLSPKKNCGVDLEADNYVA